jgi:hypothetical protein
MTRPKPEVAFVELDIKINNYYSVNYKIILINIMLT